MAKKLPEILKINTLSGVLTYVSIGLIGLLFTGIMYSFSQNKLVRETAETQKQLVRAVRVLSKNDSVIIHRLDDKVSKKEFEALEREMALMRKALENIINKFDPPATEEKIQSHLNLVSL